MQVAELIQRAGRKHGDAVAVEDDHGQRSFAEIAERSARLANALLGLGLEPGDRVLDLQSNAVSYVESDFGISTAGMCRVALNYRLSPADWLRIAEDCGARTLILAERFRDVVEDLKAAVDHVVVIGEAGPGELAYESLLAAADAAPPRLDITPEHLISLNYSSGTTGSPKGAMRTHRNRIASLVNMSMDVLGGIPAPDDAWCHAGPITHASGLFVLPHFFHGTRQVLLPTWDTGRFVEAVTERGITGTVLVPTMVARLLADESVTAEQMAGLRRLVYAGAPMPPEQIRRAMERLTPNLLQMYGLVEAIPPVTVLRPVDHHEAVRSNPEVLASAGVPAFGVELKVVDEDGVEVPVGELGEVLTRGDHVMRGYWGIDDGTAAKAVVEGWLHTGDLGRMDEQGRLYLVDRKGDMIISGGYNIYPREVEDVIAELDGVAEVAVVGMEDPDWGQRVVAVYRRRPEAEVDGAAIVAHCAERLAGYKKPKEVHEVDAFPLSSTGKISKKDLKLQLADG